jgi:hypothetical protein
VIVFHEFTELVLAQMLPLRSPADSTVPFVDNDNESQSLLAPLAVQDKPESVLM